MFGQNDNKQADQNFLNQPDTPFSGTPAPGSPAGPVASDDHTASPVTNPVATPFTSATPLTTVAATASTESHPSDELLDIKQEALQALTPLVGHLEQTPEEKFRTTMMMIQASDDQSLLKDAFSAAKAITDDKARAQALLDVINEINYFTQQHHN